ncbi:kinesin-like protein KIF14 [Huso huso]|uniref:Kinesin-like protein KIF14 n=1 Tax=Huso huso TaxID=61971 RepID=A0ABR0ZH64_HUSHU
MMKAKKIGCDSDISSMVTEALNKSSQSIKRTVQLIGQLALVTGTELHTAEQRSKGARTYQNCIAVPLYEGACKGLTSLLDDRVHQAKEMQREVQAIFPQSELLQAGKNISLLTTSIQNYIINSNPVRTTR